MPIAADSHTAAAVVSPCTAPRRVIMNPAPKKPIPVTIWAATRDGSSTIVCADKTSPNPYLLINRLVTAMLRLPSVQRVDLITWVRWNCQRSTM
jgi:hypothetical protein